MRPKISGKIPDLAVAPFFGGFTFDAHEGVGYGFEAVLGDFFAAFDAEAVFSLLYPGEGRIDESEPFEVLGAQGFYHFAVNVVRGYVGEIFGVHAFDYFLEVFVAVNQIGDNFVF
jgi:hypothetical protein